MGEVAVMKNNYVAFLHPKTLKQLRILRGHSASVMDICHIPAIKKIVTSSADRTMIIWEHKHMKKIKQITTYNPQLCLWYDPDSHMLFSGCTDAMIYTWDLNNYYKRPFKLEGHQDSVMHLLSFPELNVLWSASMDKTIKLWDLKTGTCRETKTGHNKGVHMLAYAKEYRCLLSAGCEQDVYVWNPLSNTLVHQMKGHDKPLVGVHAFDDSPEVISIDVDGKIMIWDVRTFKCVQKLRPPEITPNSIEAFCYDSDNCQIITGGQSVLSAWKSIESDNIGKIKKPITNIVYNSVYKHLLTSTGGMVSDH